MSGLSVVPIKELFPVVSSLRFDFNRFSNGSSERTSERKALNKDFPGECYITVAPIVDYDDSYYDNNIVKGYSFKLVGSIFEVMKNKARFRIQVKVSANGKVMAEEPNLSIASDSTFHHSFKLMNPITSYLVSGSLPLDVEVTIQGISEAVKFKESFQSFCTDIIERRGWMEDSQFSDFKFIVKGKDFKVHRQILAAVSPVFVKLFTTHMTEAKNNECIINEIDPRIFEDFLSFVYSGKLPDNLTQVAKELYEVAHYYEIEALRKICRDKVEHSLSVFNAIELYDWAGIYHEHDGLQADSWEIIKKQILKVEIPSHYKLPTSDQVQKLNKLKKEEREVIDSLRV